MCQYFNPRAPCGARRNTHTWWCLPSWISIHAPRVGRDLLTQAMEDVVMLFQSTRPVWGATLPVGFPYKDTWHFNPRAPCGARRDIVAQNWYDYDISIHAPRVGRDGKFDDFTPSNLHKRYKRVLARPKNTREKGKIKQKRAYIHAFSAFLGCEGSGTFCALVLRTQYR